LQITLIVGFTSALYALAGNQYISTTGIFPDSCELLQIGDYQDDLGALGVWVKTFWLVVEHFLMQDSSLQCMRLYSQHSFTASLLMMLFQLISAILMINMLIAMSKPPGLKLRSKPSKGRQDQRL